MHDLEAAFQLQEMALEKQVGDRADGDGQAERHDKTGQPDARAVLSLKQRKITWAIVENNFMIDIKPERNFTEKGQRAANEQAPDPAGVHGRDDQKAAAQGIGAQLPDRMPGKPHAGIMRDQHKQSDSTGQKPFAPPAGKEVGVPMVDER